MGKKFVVYTVNTEEEYKKLRKLWISRMMTDNIPLMKLLRKNEQ
jgi:glycerophosphoryl diester phosphodiesterase